MRHVIFLVVFAATTCFADVRCEDSSGNSNGTWSGTPRTCVGAVRPVTYILRNDSGPDTEVLSDAAIRAEAQAVIDDAWYGDTIKLTAGQRFNFGNSDLWAVQIRRPSGGDGYLTITTTMDYKLPNDGTRVTPAYIPLMPIIETQANSYMLGIPAGTDRIKIRGLYFRPHPNLNTTTGVVYGFLRIGGSATDPYNTTTGVIGGDGILTITTLISVPVSDGFNKRIHVRSARGVEVGQKLFVGYNLAGATLYTVSAKDTSVYPNTIDMSEPIAQPHALNSRVFHQLADTSVLPDNIVIQHCVFRNPDHAWQINRFIGLDSRASTVRDNYFSAPLASVSLGDAQVISVGNIGPGPYTIENNYLDGGAENIMFGGNYSSTNGGAHSALVRYNFFPHIPEREYVGPWTLTQDTGITGVTRTYAGVSVPGLPEKSPRLVFRGRHVHSSTVSGQPYFQAMNMGIVGMTEPDWTILSGPGEFLYDYDPTRVMDGVTLRPTTLCNGVNYPGDGVCWQRMPGSQRNVIKNNFEVKHGENLVLQYNVFDWFGSMYPYNAQQYAMLMIKANVVERVTGACSNGLGFPQCFRGSNAGFKLLNNVLRGFPGGLHLGGSPRWEPGGSGNYEVRGNLFVQTERPIHSHYSGYKFISIAENNDNTNTVPRKLPITNIVVKKNTIFSPFVPPGGALSFGAAINSGNFKGVREMIGNIWPRGAAGAMAYNGGSNPTDGGITVAEWFPGTSSGGIWGNNVIVGSSTAAFPENTVWTGCSSVAACLTSTSQTPDWSSVLMNAEAEDFRVKDDHWGKRSLQDGADVGADVEELPLIRNLNIAASDRLAVFRWSLTQSNLHIPCVLEVNTSPDFETGQYVGELSDVGTYYRDDADDAPRNIRFGVERMLSIGYSVPLIPSTPHYYRLHCGGDTRRGTFMTEPAMSDAGDQVISRSRRDGSSAPMSVEYGSSYVRGTDTIVDSQTIPAACEADGVCSVSLSATRGQLVFFRWIEHETPESAGFTSGISTFIAK